MILRVVLQLHLVSFFLQRFKLGVEGAQPLLLVL